MIACRRVGVRMDMHLCRKIFASYLSSRCGIQSEVVDFLQGKVSTSVFSSYYLTPSAGLKDRILQAVEELSGKLDYVPIIYDAIGQTQEPFKTIISI